MEIKKLTRHELASVRRAYTTRVGYEKKINNLRKKQAILEEEIKVLEEQMEGFEAPIKAITGGLSSAQYLDLINQEEVANKANEELSKDIEKVEEQQAEEQTNKTEE